MEKNLKGYDPEPMCTDDVNLPEELVSLIDELAKNVHEVWAKKRKDTGWVFGPNRDDERKHHPGIVSFDDLPESEKEYDRLTAMETLKLILKLGFTISKK